MPLNKDIQYSRGVNLPLGFVYQSLGDPFCIAQMPSPCPSCWKTLLLTSCTHAQPIPKSLWSKYMYLNIYTILCNIAIVNPQQNHRGTLSIPSCPILDTHLISDYSQVQSRYLHIWRGQFYNFNLFGLWKVDNWTSEKRTLFLYDKCLQNNVDDPTLFLSWSFILRSDFDLFLNIILIQF